MTRETVYFGNYWQEDTNSDGIADANDKKNPIKWQILKKYSDGTALLISDKILFTSVYNSKTIALSSYGCTWNISEIRNNLNSNKSGGFLYDAFDADEQKYLMSKKDDDSGDKVFLLSKDEAVDTELGFYSNGLLKDIARSAEVTDFARQQGEKEASYSVSSTDMKGSWWLMNTNDSLFEQSFVVNAFGNIPRSLEYVNKVNGVRPVIILNLNSTNVNNGEIIDFSVRECDWDTLTFGKYNGKNINWRVLSIDGNDVFLVAETAVILKAYNDTAESSSWKDSTIRSWLNKEFYDEAFDSYEKAMIKSTILSCENRLTGESLKDEMTEDKVFVLSPSEVTKESYGFSNNDITSSVTRSLNDNWWLRTPGSSKAMYVASDGCICDDVNVDDISIGIRPAVHIDLSKASWKLRPTSKSNTEGKIENDGQTNTPVVAKKSQKIDNIKNITKTYSTKTFYLKAKTSGNGKISYKSSNSKVARVSKYGKVILVGAGKTKITVTASETNSYKKETKIIILTVKRGKQKIQSKYQKIKLVYSDEQFNLGVKVLGNAKVTYKSSNPKILTVSKTGKVKLKGIGKANIIIKTKKNLKYGISTKKISINVLAPKVKLKCKALSGKKVTLSWTASSVYDGYYAEFSLYPDFRVIHRKGGFLKKRSSRVIDGFATIGVKYYVRITPYKIENGVRKYYSSSNIESFIVR
ncbi:MAG: Ig-like domain-containing protein [Eubacterium sp.]|nr:Ig-like domain-containing protein [Eubacterium sp.]